MIHYLHFTVASRRNLTDYFVLLQYTMKLSFVQAARGVNKEVQVNVVDTCQKCSGSRTEPGTKAIRCHYCNGSGYETISTGNHCCSVKLSH